MTYKHKWITDIFTKSKKEGGVEVWFSGIEGNGEYKAVTHKGRVMEHSFYKNGKWDGELKRWHVNGQMMEHSFYKNGKRNGESKSWNDGGKLVLHIIYKDGKEIKNLL